MRLAVDHRRAFKKNPGIDHFVFQLAASNVTVR